MSAIEELFRKREEHAWERYRKAKYVYRVDPIDMWGVLTKEGIVSQYAIEEGDPRKGFFFFVGGKEWAHTVAMSFLPMSKAYVLHRISKRGIDASAVRWDNVAEAAASVSFYCLQDRVEPKYIEFMGVFEHLFK